MGDDSVWAYPGDGEGPCTRCPRRVPHRPLRGDQRRLRRVRGRDRMDDRRRALRLVIRVRRAAPRRLPRHTRRSSARNGGDRCTAQTGGTPRARSRTSATAATIRSCTCRGTMRPRTAGGPGPASRPRQSGSARPRGGLVGTAFPWGDDLEPGGEHRMNVFQGTFPGGTRAPTDTSAPRRLTRSRPTSSVSTTSPATCGSGAPTGSTSATTRTARGRTHGAGVRRAARATRRLVPVPPLVLPPLPRLGATSAVNQRARPATPASGSPPTPR